MGKICPRCEQDKPLSDYYKNRAKANGRHSYCKECNKERHKEFSSTRRGKTLKGNYQRSYALKKFYGLTLEQYDGILESQNRSCAVCRRPASEFSKRLAVDHDHNTGEIFGLLCWNCNRILIGKHRDPELFKAASEYLEKGTGLFVPPDQVKPKRRRRRKKHK